MKFTQTQIIAAVAIACALGYYFLVYKKSANDLAKAPASADPFSIDDTAAYNGVVALLNEADSGANAWVGPYVKDAYSSSPSKINGRASKAQTFVDMMDRVSYNEKGKFTNRKGKKILWPQEMKDKMYSNFINPLKAKYTVL